MKQCFPKGCVSLRCTLCVLLAGSHGPPLNIVLVLHSNNSDFTRLHRDLVAGKLGLPSIFGAQKMTSNFTVLSKYQNIL